MALIGYARVSTDDQNQNLALQLDALHQAGVARIFEDRGAAGTQQAHQGF